jgi:peptide-methionine (S)-S-oxide reductase
MPAQADVVAKASEVATFASGCFWGTEHIFLKYFKEKGILSTTVGYTGGRTESKKPSYRDVCDGDTGHAEAVKIVFDPEVLGYADLVGEEFFSRSIEQFVLRACRILLQNA